MTANATNDASSPYRQESEGLDGCAIVVPCAYSGVSTGETAGELEAAEEVPVANPGGRAGVCLRVMAVCAHYGHRRILVDRPDSGVRCPSRSRPHDRAR